MKKKLLLSALFAALCALIVTGCDSSSDDPVPVTPVNLDTPDTLVGTYEVDYFITEAAGIGITNDCTKALANLNQSAACEPANNVNKAGKAVIVKNQDGTYSVTSKMQIWGGIFDTILGELASFVTPNMYNYTAYNAVNADSINTQDKTINSGANAVVGVSGRNMVALTSDSTAPFSFKVNDDGTITSTVALSQPLPSTTKVVLRKVSDAAGTLDPNTLLDSSAPGFQGVFDPEVYPTPIDLAKIETLQGEYNVTFFGSGVENVRPADNPFASFANMFYISNDCAKAIQWGLASGDPVNGTAPFCVAVEDPADNQQVTMLGGKIVIKVDNGQIYVTSKMQMEGGSVEGSTADKYQYTEYYPTGSLSGTGVKGYNYDENTSAISTSLTDNPLSPFTISSENGLLKINLILKDKSVLDGFFVVDANTLVYAEKISNKSAAPSNELFVPFN